MSSSSSPSSSVVQSDSGRANYRARVTSKQEVAPSHFQLRLEAADLAEVAQPGQFVHVLTTPDSSEWNFDPLLRRAFSIMNVNSPDQDSIDLLFRANGRGTVALAKARVGDEIDLIGPLGRPFDLSPFDDNATEKAGEFESEPKSADKVFHVKQLLPAAILIGGGVGVPPLVFLGQTLALQGIEVHSIIGARNAADVIGWNELSAVCREVSITTDDGSRGHHGRVTDLLLPLIESLTSREAERTIAPVVYTCGPLPMLRAIAQICGRENVRCQVSLEENMPCGIGVCNGCVVRTRQPFADAPNLEGCQDTQELSVNRVVGNEWSPYRAYRRVCVEGPACWADEIDWEHQG